MLRSKTSIWNAKVGLNFQILKQRAVPSILVELANMVKSGHRAVMLYIVQRERLQHFPPSRRYRPGLCRRIPGRTDCRCETLCYQCAITKDGITLDRALPISID